MFLVLSDRDLRADRRDKPIQEVNISDFPLPLEVILQTNYLLYTDGKEVKVLRHRHEVPLWMLPFAIRAYQLQYPLKDISDLLDPVSYEGVLIRPSIQNLLES